MKKAKKACYGLNLILLRCKSTYVVYFDQLLGGLKMCFLAFSQGVRPAFGCEPAFACMAFSPFFAPYLLQNDAKTYKKTNEVVEQNKLVNRSLISEKVEMERPLIC